MKKKHFLFFFVFLFCLAGLAIAQLNVRHFVTKNDMRINAEQDEDIEWYQGDQVQYDIYVRRGRKRVNIPTNAVPIWRTWLAADATTLYVLDTGTVVSATDGHVRFILTPGEANTPTGTYLSAADVSIGSTNIGTIANSSAIVHYSPNSTNVAYIGTVATASPFYVVAGDLLEGNMDGGTYTISNAVFVGDGSGLTSVTASATGSTIYVESTLITNPNFDDAGDITFGFSGTNVTGVIKANVITSNDVATATDTAYRAGGGGGSAINVETGNVVLVTAVTSIDFLGADFTGTSNATTEADIAIHGDLTRDAEWDTLAEINTASTDTDAVLDTDIGSTVQAFDSDLSDLADGSLTGSKVGTGIDDDNVTFDDANSDFVATSVGAALEELVVAGTVNSATGKVSWGQLVDVPAGFADETDDGASGGIATVQEGDSTVVTAATSLDFLGADFDVTSNATSEADIVIAAAITRDAEAAAAYQPLEATLTDIADGTIAENLINTANPWADDEVVDTVTAGLAATSTVSLAGDSATAFFTSGFIELNRGGLGADVSNYTGVIGISGGAALNVNTIAELETAMGSVDIVTTNSGDITKAELETLLSDVTNILEDDIAETLTANWVANANLTIGNTNTSGGKLIINEDTDAGAHTFTIQATNMVADVVLTLPTTDGAANQILESDGAGVLSWVDNTNSPIDERAAAANVDMGGYAITNAGLYTGVNTMIVTQVRGTLGQNLTLNTVSPGSNIIHDANTVLNSNLTVTGTLTLTTTGQIDSNDVATATDTAYRTDEGSTLYVKSTSVASPNLYDNGDISFTVVTSTNIQADIKAGAAVSSMTITTLTTESISATAATLAVSQIVAQVLSAPSSVITATNQLVIAGTNGTVGTAAPLQIESVYLYAAGGDTRWPFAVDDSGGTPRAPIGLSSNATPDTLLNIPTGRSFHFIVGGDASDPKATVDASGNLATDGTIDGTTITASVGLAGPGGSITAIDDDNVNFDDAGADFIATTVGGALEEFRVVGVVNSATNKVDWSQLFNVPAGFADGTDASSAGGDPVDSRIVTNNVDGGGYSATNLNAVTSTGTITATAFVGIDDAAVPNTITASLYAPLSGATFTGGITMNTTNEFTQISGQILTRTNRHATLAPIKIRGAKEASGLMWPYTFEDSGDVVRSIIGITTAATPNVVMNMPGGAELHVIVGGSDADPKVIMDASGNVTADAVVTGTGFTIGSAAITEAELEILDGATITTAETDTLSNGSNADSLHVHASAGLSGIVNADLSGSAGITSANIADGTINQIDIEDATIDANAMAANSVGESELIESMNFVAEGLWDFDIAAVQVPNGSVDGTVNVAGEIYLNTTDEQLAFHSAADGEISGEVALSLIQHFAISFDPSACFGTDSAVDRLFLMTVKDQAPEGIVIDEWTLSFEADPTTEFAGDFKRATAFIGVGSAAVIDVCDTTAGVSTEDTDANINAGAVVANGQVLYLESDASYTETGHQMIFEMWYHAEED